MSTLSRRSRNRSGTTTPGSDGAALGRTPNASAGVFRPIARCGLTRVVVVAEPVELDLERFDRLSRLLAGEEPLERLVEALDLAAGLRVARTRVHRADPQASPSRARSRTA